MGANTPLAGRRDSRIAVSIPVALQVESEGKKSECAAFLLNVCERGVRLRAKATLTRGQIVEVIPTEGPRFTVRSRVVWVNKADPTQEAEVGLEFLGPFPTKSWGRGADGGR